MIIFILDYGIIVYLVSISGFFLLLILLLPLLFLPLLILLIFILPSRLWLNHSISNGYLEWDINVTHVKVASEWSEEIVKCVDKLRERGPHCGIFEPALRENLKPGVKERERERGREGYLCYLITNQCTHVYNMYCYSNVHQ